MKSLILPAIAAASLFIVSCGNEAKTPDSAATATTETQGATPVASTAPADNAAAGTATATAPAPPSTGAINAPVSAAPSANPKVTQPETKPVATGATTSMKFEEMKYDFGKVKEGEKYTHVFKFTNTGKEPLIIQKAEGSCGCTVPDYPKAPIAPGKSEEIKVSYSPKGSGKQSKNVTITANTEPAQTKIFISADVEPKG